MGFIVYCILGFIVSLANWIYVLPKDAKDHLNVCISLFIAFVFWPAICIGWSYRFVEYSNKKRL